MAIITQQFKTISMLTKLELRITEDDNIELAILAPSSYEYVYLTPAQARRIAAHLVKLAEMREGEKR